MSTATPQPRLRLTPPRPRRTPIVAIALALLLLIVLAVIRLVTLTPAAVKVNATAARSVRVPGSPPKLNWPTGGQAAFTVQGLGSLGSSGSQTPQPTASLAKVMTAYLLLKHYPLSGSQDGFTLTIGKADAKAEAQDVAQDESTAPVSAGETLTERQLLEALLIPSGDNIAQILATRVSGSVPAFVAQMNTQAKQLGMNHTTYTDPSGFDATTVSTAADQLKIFRAAMQLPVFRQVVEMPSAALPTGTGEVTNYNPLIASGYYGKTGSDSSAEGCLAFFKNERVAGRNLTEIGVVMGQGVGSDTEAILGAAATAAENLVVSATSAIKPRTVLPAGAHVLAATSADGSKVAGVTTAPLRVLGWGGLREHAKISTVAQTASGLSSGQRLGSVKLTGTLPLPAGGRAQTPVKAAQALATPGLGWRISHLL